MALLLPGSVIPAESLPAVSNRALTLGPGLRSIPAGPTTTTAGTLHTDARKNAIWLQPPSGGRYNPSVGDLVLATVHHSSSEQYSCTVVPHTPFALLGQLSFEGASRKTRPMIPAGGLVYARVARVERGGETELECVDPATGKAGGLGWLKGGMVLDITHGWARRLMQGEKGGAIVLEALGEKLGFEVAVGRNGRIWVDAGGIKETNLVCRVIREAETLNVVAQRKLVEKALRAV